MIYKMDVYFKEKILNFGDGSLILFDQANGNQDGILFLCLSRSFSLFRFICLSVCQSLSLSFSSFSSSSLWSREVVQWS